MRFMIELTKTIQQMNNYEILFIGIIILNGIIVFYYSISTIIETRKMAIKQFNQNSKNRKKKFDEKN